MAEILIIPADPAVKADDLPEGYARLVVPDRYCAPVFQPGDTVVADTTDRIPVHGEFYVVEYGAGRRAERSVAQARRKSGSGNWYLGPVTSRTPAGASGYGMDMVYASDGPYRCPEDMVPSIVGRVLAPMTERASA